MTATAIESQEALDRFNTKVADERERFNKLVAWHLRMFVESDGAIELPWCGDDSWINVNKYHDYPEHDYSKPREVDVEATLAYLSLVAKTAIREGGSIKKDYSDSDFTLEVTISKEPTIVVRYYAKRDAVCTKRVVGTKVIPARVTPERVEEIVEWDCEPVSLLAPAPSAE